MSRTEALPPGLRRPDAQALPPGLRRPVSEELPPGIRKPVTNASVRIPIQRSTWASAYEAKVLFQAKLTCAALCGDMDTGPTSIGLPVPRRFVDTRLATVWAHLVDPVMNVGSVINHETAYLLILDIAEAEFVPCAKDDGANGMKMQVYDSNGVPHTLHIRQQRVRWLGVEHAYSIRGFGHLVLKWKLQPGDYFVFRRTTDRMCISYRRMCKIDSIGISGLSDCAPTSLVTDRMGPGRCSARDPRVGPDGKVAAQAVHTGLASMESSKAVANLITVAGDRGLAVQAGVPSMQPKRCIADERDTETVVEEHGSVTLPATPPQGKSPALTGLSGQFCTLQLDMNHAQEQQSGSPVPRPTDTAGPVETCPESAGDSPSRPPGEHKGPCLANGLMPTPASTHARAAWPVTAVPGALAPLTPKKVHVGLQECAQGTIRQRLESYTHNEVPADVWSLHQQRVATASGHAVVHSYGHSATNNKPCNTQSHVKSDNTAPPCPASGSDCGSSRTCMLVQAAHQPELQAVAHWFPDVLPVSSAVQSLCEVGDTEDDIEIVEGDGDSCCTMPEYDSADDTCDEGATQCLESSATCMEGTQATAVDSPGAEANLLKDEVSSKRSTLMQESTAPALKQGRHERQVKVAAPAGAGSKSEMKSEKTLGRKLEKEGQQSRKRRRTCIEARQAERDKGQRVKGKSTFLFGSFGEACISFSDDKATLKQLLELPQGAERAKAYGSFATYCTRMLRSCGVEVQRETKERGSEVVSLEVPIELLQQFPVLQDLWEAVGDNPVDKGNASDSTSTSFHPPASLWALACLVLVGDGDADLWHIFGNPSREPRLLADTLEMAHYLNDTQACPQLDEWMLEVFAEVVQAFKSDDGFTVCPDDAPAVWHLCEVLLAVSEHHSIFSQLASQPPPDLPKPRSRARAATKSRPATRSWNKSNVPVGNAGGQARNVQEHAHESEKSPTSEDTASTLAPIRLEDTPAEDVLNLPPPLCHAWFRHMRTIAVRLDSGNSAAQHVATGALCSATALEKLALYVCAPQAATDVGSTVPKSHPDVHPHKSSIERRTRSKVRGQMPESVASGTVATPKAAPAVPAAPPCSFAMVQQCLIAPRQLRELHMHGVRFLPHELQSFGSALRWLAPSLEQLTLCRIQGLDDALVRAQANLPCMAGTTHSRKGAMNEKNLPTTDRALSLHSYAVDEKRLLCSALAQLGKLQVLTFPELYEFVCRGTDVLRPMSFMDSLKTVFVHAASVSKLCRAEPGIHFEALPGEGCSCHGV